MKNLLIALIIATVGGSVIAGCDSNPTNAPTEQAIKEADEARAKAIDNDASLTPEGKQKMKEMMGLVPGKGRGGEERK